jgi:hypothetical protein
MIKDFKQEIRRADFKRRYELQIDKMTVALLIALGVALALLAVSFLGLFIVTFY